VHSFLTPKLRKSLSSDISLELTSWGHWPNHLFIYLILRMPHYDVVPSSLERQFPYLIPSKMCQHLNASVISSPNVSIISWWPSLIGVHVFLRCQLLFFIPSPVSQHLDKAPTLYCSPLIGGHIHSIISFSVCQYLSDLCIHFYSYLGMWTLPWPIWHGVIPAIWVGC